MPVLDHYLYQCLCKFLPTFIPPLGSGKVEISPSFLLPLLIGEGWGGVLHNLGKNRTSHRQIRLSIAVFYLLLL